ncbi:uncharacterized protein [Chelonus insularis]|uniref:uncharacterized protein isoform X2 n=1 Tax=Chelonus insularis TaxID=460826 RepID=UPI001588E447|nr:uncharacterized protein LOC118065172 isoform X2 [Chelonus insularis]
MSFQKGNSNRSRPQKYQNSHAFKNNLYDTSHKTKTINNIQVANVCKRCKEIIEWKIKYKKYKPLKAPSKCTKCDQKCVKHAYHIMCESCALKLEVCPKCGEQTEIIKSEVKEEVLILDRELRLLLKKLPERKRRTFYRYMKRGNKSEKKENHSDNDEKQLNREEKILITEENKVADLVVPLTRDDLLAKLQSLIISNERRKNDEDDYYDDDIDDDEFNNFCKKMNKDINKDNVNNQSTTTTSQKPSDIDRTSNNNTKLDESLEKKNL